jgi:hypothetical protein
MAGESDGDEGEQGSEDEEDAGDAEEGRGGLKIDRRGRRTLCLPGSTSAAG